MLTLAGGMFACMMVMLIVSININNRALERERQAQAEARQVACTQMIIIRDEYREQADTLSPAGRKIGEAWAYLASTFCKG
jgi:hypothetical protein